MTTIDFIFLKRGTGNPGTRQIWWENNQLVPNPYI